MFIFFFSSSSSVHIFLFSDATLLFFLRLPLIDSLCFSTSLLPVQWVQTQTAACWAFRRPLASPSGRAAAPAPPFQLRKKRRRQRSLENYGTIQMQTNTKCTQWFASSPYVLILLLFLLSSFPLFLFLFLFLFTFLWFSASYSVCSSRDSQTATPSAVVPLPPALLPARTSSPLSHMSVRRILKIDFPRKSSRRERKTEYPRRLWECWCQRTARCTAVVQELQENQPNSQKRKFFEICFSFSMKPGVVAAAESAAIGVGIDAGEGFEGGEADRIGEELWWRHH